MCFCAGGSVGVAVWAAGVPDRGGVELLADAEASAPRAAEAAVDHVRAVHVWAAALGGQLLAPVRFRVWVLVIVRVFAFRVFRPVRPAEEGGAHLGMPGVGRRPLHLSRAALLHNSSVRL